MKSFVLRILFLVVLTTACSVQAFVPSTLSNQRTTGLTIQSPLSTSTTSKTTSTTSSSTTQLYMGGKMSKFGIFSPAVYVGKIVLGNDSLNKLRGKAISLHSQYIGDFCTWIGAYHLRTQLIKKAKTNGDILGFLV